MPDTIRQQLIGAIDTKLKTILTANGYYSNLGQNVDEWNLSPLDTAGGETFRLTYRDEDEGRADVTVGNQDMTLSITVLILASGSTSLADVREMLADVVAAMHADPTWSGLANDTNMDGTAKLVKAEAADTAGGVELKFGIEYSVTRGAS